MTVYDEYDKPLYNDRSDSVHGKVASKMTTKQINKEFENAEQKQIHVHSPFMVLASYNQTQ